MAHFCDIAQALAMGLDLGLHLNASPVSPIGSSDSNAISRRTTWYCIIHLDVMLCCQLGRCPLTPSSYSTAFPPLTGSDEWELWRSESVSSLRKLYNTNSAGPAAVLSPYGCVTPTRALSTFNQSILLIKIAHRIVSILNSTISINRDVRLLHSAVHDLDEFRKQLLDIDMIDSSLSSVPQHRLDLFVLWHYLRIVLWRNL